MDEAMARPRPSGRLLAAVAGVLGLVAMASLATLATGGGAQAAGPKVLHVGTYQGRAGEYPTIQDAIDAAAPGDWILVAPGDYHEQHDHLHPDDEPHAGVVITTPNLHLRGMDRNEVVIDGTLPGSSRCATDDASQDPGVLENGNPEGRSGLVVWKASGVSLENLTVCNFLGGYEANEIWWNGGDGTAEIGMGSYHGAYLTATSTYWGGAGRPQAAYGIFVSNARGPGLITRTYASNMNDSAYYIGACPDCNAVLDRAHGQHSALGYSGTNSGGHLQIVNSEFDDNKAGIVTNSQNNDDAPSPQDGRCPGSTTSCFLIAYNHIHDNNNPNVPAAGSANLAPVGAGIVISGGRHDRVVGNLIEHQGSWGILFAPFIDNATPPLDQLSKCEGGVVTAANDACFYDDWGNEGAANRFRDVGTFGNPSNGALADFSGAHAGDGNWWHDNTDASGTLAVAPSDLLTRHGKEGNSVGSGGNPLVEQILCATEVVGPCPPDATHQYPRATNVTVAPLPAQQTMPDPCQGVPDDAWCPASATSTTTTTSDGGSSSSSTGSSTSVPGTVPPAVPPTPVATEPRYTG